MTCRCLVEPGRAEEDRSRLAGALFFGPFGRPGTVLCGTRHVYVAERDLDHRAPTHRSRCEDSDIWNVLVSIRQCRRQPTNLSKTSSAPYQIRNEPPFGLERKSNPV